MHPQSLKEFLEEKVSLYNQPKFILSDPIQVPHSFSDPKNIEISAFLTTSIAWGQRNTIIKNAFTLMQLMDYAPFDFIRNFTLQDLKLFENFKHRTFNSTDCKFFIQALQNIYINHNGLEGIFTQQYNKHKSLKQAIIIFRKMFLEMDHPARTEKHISNIEKGSPAKRLNLFLRWMIRKDNRGVDFGIWDNIPMSFLYLPLDVHTGNVSRQLGLLTRKSNDWQAVEEITQKLIKMDPNDPVKYDYALFGLGIFEKF